MIKNLPVLIIAFDRPSKLKNLLHMCYESGIRNFYVAIDGSLYDDIHREKLFENIIAEFDNASFRSCLYEPYDILGDPIQIATPPNFIFDKNQILKELDLLDENIMNNNE